MLRNQINQMILGGCVALLNRKNTETREINAKSSKKYIFKKMKRCNRKRKQKFTKQKIPISIRNLVSLGLDEQMEDISECLNKSKSTKENDALKIKSRLPFKIINLKKKRNQRHKQNLVFKLRAV